MFVEVTQMPGSGQLVLTGNLGEIIKESARIALGWIKRFPSRCLRLDLVNRISATRSRLECLSRSWVRWTFIFTSPRGLLAKTVHRVASRSL
jgi:hypothetical protein